MTASSPAIQPYLAVTWFAAAAAGLSLFMVPLLTIGTHGGNTSAVDQLVAGDTGGEVGEKRAIVDFSEISEKQ